MLSLNLITRAVIIHEGKFLVTTIDDGVREPFYTFLGGHLGLGETLMECVERETWEEVGIKVAPTKLLYVVENFFLRSRSKLHEVGYYFICQPIEPIQGDLLDVIAPNLGESIVPSLLEPDQLMSLNFQPELVGKLVVEDSKEQFSGCPKHVVINELPGDVACSGSVSQL